MTEPYTVENCVERAKREILADIADGTVPASVRTFSELHDYVDANGYGGAFEDDAPEPIDIDFWNEVQGQVDVWIRNGQAKRGRR